MLNVVCFQLSWRSFTHVSVIDLAFVHLKRWCACAKDHLDPSLNKHNTHSYTNKCLFFFRLKTSYRNIQMIHIIPRSPTPLYPPPHPSSDHETQFLKESYGWASWLFLLFFHWFLFVILFSMSWSVLESFVWVSLENKYTFLWVPSLVPLFPIPHY